MVVHFQRKSGDPKAYISSTRIYLEVTEGSNTQKGLRGVKPASVWAEKMGYLVTSPDMIEAPQHAQLEDLHDSLLLHVFELGRFSEKQLELVACTNRRFWCVSRLPLRSVVVNPKTNTLNLK